MSLQLWLPLNGNMENQGLADIEAITIGSPVYTTGKTGKAVKSCGYTLKAESTKQILNNNELTIAFWVYVDLDEGSTSNRSMFFGVDSMSSYGGRQFSLFNFPTSNDLHWSWQNCVNGEYTLLSANTLTGVIPTRTWTHIAVTYNNPKGKIYINGVEKISFSGQYKTDSFEFDTPVIHQSDYYRYNDYRIYDHCLSPKEIKELSKGLCLHYKLNGNGLYNPNLMVNTGFIGDSWTHTGNKTGWYQLPLAGDEISTDVTKDGLNSIHRYRTGTTATTWSELQYYQRDNTTLVAGKTYTFSVWVYTENSDWLSTSTNTFSSNTRIYNSSGTKIGEIGSVNLKPSKAGVWEKKSVTFTMSESYTDYSWWYRYFTIPRDVDVYFSQPKLEEGSVATPWCPNSSDSLYSALGYDDATEYDVSGFCNDGTKVGTLSIGQDSPRYSCSTKFNKGYVLSPVPNTLKPDKEITLSCWVKLAANVDSGELCLFNCYEGGGAGLNISGGKYGMQVYSGSYKAAYVSISDMTSWHHFAGTFDGQYIKTYIDGELKATVDAGADSIITYNATVPWEIGGNPSAGGGYDSKMNNAQAVDARIYATALDATGIKELYNTPVSITDNGTLMTQGEVIE